MDQNAKRCKSCGGWNDKSAERCSLCGAALPESMEGVTYKVKSQKSPEESPTVVVALYIVGWLIIAGSILAGLIIEGANTGLFLVFAVSGSAVGLIFFSIARSIKNQIRIENILQKIYDRMQ